MTVEVIPYGGAAGLEAGELGGVQFLFEDLERKTRFFLDFGQRPDPTAEYYGPGEQPSPFQALEIGERLGLFPKMDNFYRQDYEKLRGRKIKWPPPCEIVTTHGHYDHIGGLGRVRHDLPVWAHYLTKAVLYGWQYTSGRTRNQFIDLFDHEEGIRIPRQINLFKENQPFKIGELEATAYTVDHSLVGACGFIINTSTGKIGISGDIRKRGRRGKETESFIEALIKEEVSYLFWEGSLLHFPHEGNEEKLTEVVSELLKGRTFASFGCPPRDTTRLYSLYQAAKENKRMLVIRPDQAILLKLLEGQGVKDCPKLNWKYIGVYLPRKGKGLLDREGYSLEEAEKDYSYLERGFLKENILWEEEHLSKVQRVSINDLKNRQEEFFVNMPAYTAAGMLVEIEPKEKSIYIRSHPEPWTEDMKNSATRFKNILNLFGMDEGEREDYLTAGIKRDMHQVHVTGHLNLRETTEILTRIKEQVPNCKFIPYHCKDPRQIEEIVGKERTLIPERGKKLILA